MLKAHVLHEPYPRSLFFSLFFQNCFNYLECHTVTCDFLNGLLKACKIIAETELMLWITLWKTFILTILICPIYEYEMSFYLFRSCFSSCSFLFSPFSFSLLSLLHFPPSCLGFSPWTPILRCSPERPLTHAPPASHSFILSAGILDIRTKLVCFCSMKFLDFGVNIFHSLPK